ncbi:DUF2332 domain-containing protein [Novosphingobium aquimarinum]|uniref:DUF2332 domain-containing protein n=1 Tax=Novosphingobium aquimarinum TaxID=2682494 RepID=UPI0012ECAAB6|nr:DUF2332 domain-containing protein [Novosphingobium aquimarinum]
MVTKDKAADRAFHGDVREAFANQIAYCRANGAAVTARVVGAVLQLLDEPDASPFVARIAQWPGQALADGLPLRAAAAVHARHLSGTIPELDAIYADDDADDVAIVRDVCHAYSEAMMPWLDGPPQTNEAGRSANFIAAMLWLAEQGLPRRFACLEIGSSAGINLMIERYRYDLGGVIVGPERPALTLAPEWRGVPPPPGPIELMTPKGCDIAPVDLTDPDDALRLRSYIWPEHRVRFERLAAAIAAASEQKPRLEQSTAADFVERELAVPQEPGTTRVLMHSIVWQYLPDDEQERITRAMEAAGRAASPERALAWIAVEADRTLLSHRLVVRHWPGDGGETKLAIAHAHGAWIDWRA